LDETYTNTFNSFKYINADISLFNNYEIVLLSSNFIIDKNKSTKNVKNLCFNKMKKKKTFCKLCATIWESFKNGFYNIIIERDYKEYGLYKFDICNLRKQLLIKIEENIWNKIYEENLN